MEDFNPFKCFYDRNYPIVFSLFQLNEIYRCLSIYRLTLPKDVPLVLDEILSILDNHIEALKSSQRL